MGKAMGHALCSSVRLYSVCSGEVSWLGGLKAVFTSKWGYELVFPAQTQQDKQLKSIRLFVVLTQANPGSMLPCHTGPLALFCKNTALPVRLWARRIAAGLHSFQVLVLAPLLR